MTSSMPLLPNIGEIESIAVLKRLPRVRVALADLNTTAAGMADQSILINTLSLQEAKDSSAIENIITTHDDLYRSDSDNRIFASAQAKEVHHYATALRNGFAQIKRTGLLTYNDVLDIHSSIEENRAGFRKLPGTALKNELTGETVYTPPQHHDEIIALMANLEQFIHDDDLCDWDPLTRMAVIHHRFESIHPFYDGNGRTGRIVNILYLVKQGLLDSPILYLSRYINRHRADYYRLLQTVRTENTWEEWVLFMLDGVEKTSLETVNLIRRILTLMIAHRRKLREEAPKIFSEDLINNMFRHPYTKIDFVRDELKVSRQTAAKYLDEATRIGLLSKRKLGKQNYYLNDELFDILANPIAETSRETFVT